MEDERAGGQLVGVDQPAEQLAPVDAAQHPLDLGGVHHLVAEYGGRLGDELDGVERAVGGGRGQHAPAGGRDHVHLDVGGTGTRQRVGDQVGVARHPGGGLGHGRVPYRAGGLGGFGQARLDLLAGLVGAGADHGVVCGGLDDLVPGEGEEGRAVAVRPQGAGPLGVVHDALGGGHALLEAEPDREHAGQDVAAHVAAQFAGDDRGGLVADVAADVLLQRGQRDRALVARGAAQPGGQPRVGRVVVGAGHGEHGVVAPAPGGHLGVVAERAADLIGHQQDVQAVVVAVEEELGADLGAVGGAPAEGVARDRAGHAPPQGRVLDARRGPGSAASGPRGRTCRAGSRSAWRRRASRRRPSPSAGCARWSRRSTGTRRAGSARAPRRAGRRRRGRRRGRGARAASPGSPRPRPSARRR